MKNFHIKTKHKLSKPTPSFKKINWFSSLSLILILVLIGIAAVSYVYASKSKATNIILDGKRIGATFDGIGAISGGSGNSRLLIDYPKPERSQILNYLFKPNYGANLQILKLEIGGDAAATDGSEPSIEHSQGHINCNSGYEWWIAEQAIARNPNIKLFGLQWTAPGWTGKGPYDLWTNKNIKYVIDWMNCAKSHGLKIDYIGGWDEEGINTKWYESLRSALNNSGFINTKIVAADSVVRPWQVADKASSDTNFKKAVSVIGVHDTCPSNPTTGYSCHSTFTARKLGIPLWESEMGGMLGESNAAAMVRAVNNGYIQAGITGFLEWPLLDSISPGLAFERRGLITADQPWSGNYEVNLMTWAIAQTTQFTKVGWFHIAGANAAIGNSGTYNAYESPNHSSWTLVTENTGDYYKQDVKPQVIHVKIAHLNSRLIQVWQTDLWSKNDSKWFVKEPNLYPKHNEFTYTLLPGTVVTFTTDKGKKGINKIPPPQNLSLPYINTLSSNDGSNEPPLLSPQDGSFELYPCLGSLKGNCTQQMTPSLPVLWLNGYKSVSYPYAIIGDNWSNYTVSVRVLFQNTNSSGGVIGRFDKRAGDIGNFNGYILHVTETGSWQILKNQNSNLPSKPTILASGSVGSFGLDKWHRIALSMDGLKLTAIIDGKKIGSAIDSSYSSGLAGIEADAFTTNWSNNQYQDLSITPVNIKASKKVDSFKIKSGLSSNLCVDDYHNATGHIGRPNKVDIWSCNSSKAQNWIFASGGTIQINRQCLGTYKLGKHVGDKVDLNSCTGSSNQVWKMQGSELVNSYSGKCLDAPYRVGGVQLRVSQCSGNKNQEWIKVSNT